MIVSQVIGGLGNQMFQYAAGRALSLQRDQPFKLDISRFSDYGLHQGFELQRIFNCPVELASEAEVRDILGGLFVFAFRRWLMHPSMSVLRPKSLVVEPHFGYWDGINNIPTDSYLVGYWQTEKYFSKIAEVLRSDFTFRSKLDSENAGWAERMERSSAAVSLHVRRGDYATNPKTKATHGICSLEYYRTAISFIAERVKAAEFFIFSDDMPWIQANLRVEFPCHYVTHNREKNSYNDMRLMSLCHHHIIANSSFSWWGAWLNPRPDKIVIAPTPWFEDNRLRTEDLLPARWITVQK